MLKTTLLMAILALAAVPSKAGILEDEITKALSEFLFQYDPYRVPYVDDLHFILDDDSDIHLAFKHAHLVNFSNVVCTAFNPPLIGKELTLELEMEELSFPAEHYSADGIIKSEPYSVAGVGGMVAHTLGAIIRFDVDDFSLTPLSICAAAGSLDIDLSVVRLEGQFENGEELSQEFDTYGSVIIDDLQDMILTYRSFLEGLLNNFLCHSH